MFPETKVGATGGRGGKTKNDFAIMAKSSDAASPERFTAAKAPIVDYGLGLAIGFGVAEAGLAGCYCVGFLAIKLSNILDIIVARPSPSLPQPLSNSPCNRNTLGP